MRKYFVLVLGIALAMGNPGYAQTLDLSAYLDAVQKYNNDLKLAVKERETAETKARDARSGALPTVGFSAGYNRNLTDYYMYFDASALNPQAHGVIKAPFKRDNEFSSSIALQQPLFNPLVRNAIEAANQYRTLTDFIYGASREAILTGGKKLFYQCLLLEKVHAVTKSAEINALDNYSVTKLKYDNGQISQLELLLAETRWKNAATETRKAERNLTLAMNMLKSFAGINMNSDIRVEGNLESIPETPRIASPEAVLGLRPDYQALVWEAKLRETALKAARNAYLPTVTGTVAFSYSAQSDPFMLAEENKFLFAGVQLTMPIYTGGKIDANVKAARVELEKTGVRIDKARRNISTDLENIALRIEEARSRIESAESTRNVAEKAFQIAENTTRDGLTTQLQLKDARVSFDQSMINYYAAVYDYMEAYFDWEQAVGKAAKK
jgi:outer membrane protein TolC